MQYKQYLNTVRKKNGDILADSTKEKYLTLFKKYTPFLKSSPNLNDINDKIKSSTNPLTYSMFRSYLLFKEIPLKEIQNKLDTPQRKASSLISKQFLHNKVISRAELKRLMSEVKDLRMKLIISMLYDTACRRTELINIKYGDITLIKDDKIKAQIGIIGKGNKARTVYIGTQTYDLLKEYSKGKGKKSKFIFQFRDKRGKLIKDQAHKMWSELKKYSRRILASDKHPHMFRHTKATHLADKGASAMEIMAYLGHEKIETSMIYIQVSSFVGERAFKKYAEEIL